MFIYSSFGKLRGPSAKATTDTTPQISRLYVKDTNSGKNFLIDTGADISVIPPNHLEKAYSSYNQPLYSANNSKITTYGTKTLIMNLGLTQPIKWIFTIADVTSPIIGSDILKAFNLLVDIKSNKLFQKNNSKTDF